MTSVIIVVMTTREGFRADLFQSSRKCWSKVSEVVPILQQPLF